MIMKKVGMTSCTDHVPINQDTQVIAFSGDYYPACTCAEQGYTFGIVCLIACQSTWPHGNYSTGQFR